MFSLNGHRANRDISYYDDLYSPVQLLKAIISNVITNKKIIFLNNSWERFLNITVLRNQNYFRNLNKHLFEKIIHSSKKCNPEGFVDSLSITEQRKNVIINENELLVDNNKLSVFYLEQNLGEFVELDDIAKVHDKIIEILHRSHNGGIIRHPNIRRSNFKKNISIKTYFGVDDYLKQNTSKENDNVLFITFYSSSPTLIYQDDCNAKIWGLSFSSEEFGEKTKQNMDKILNYSQYNSYIQGTFLVEI